MDPLTRLISDRRGAAERFAVLVDRPSPAAHDDQSRRDPLLDLARLAERVAEQGRAMDDVAAPSPPFRAALRTRLLAVAAVSQAGAGITAPTARAAPRPRGRRTLEVAAGTLACLVAVGGVAAAGEQSMPGDPFFGVKSTVEAVQLATSDGDLQQGQRHLQFAGNRLDEVWDVSVERAGTARERERKVGLGLDEMDRQVRIGTQQLTGAFRRSQGRGSTTEERAPLLALSRFSASRSATLQRLLDELPPASRERAAASLALVAAVGADADELLGSGDPAVGPPATGPGANGPGAPGPGVSDPGATAPGAPPAGPVPGTPGGPATSPGLPVPAPNAPAPGSGPLLPVPLPGVPALPPAPAQPGPAQPGPVQPGPALPGAPTTGGGAPTLAPSLPVQLPTLAPPPVPLPGAVPLPR